MYDLERRVPVLRPPKTISNEARAGLEPRSSASATPQFTRSSRRPGVKDLNRNGKSSAPVLSAAPPVRGSRLCDREYSAVCGPAHDGQGSRNLCRWNVLPCACTTGSAAHCVRPRYQPDAAACKTYVPAFAWPACIHMKSLAPPVSELLPPRPHVRHICKFNATLPLD